ncbi:hypothetical protein PENTCL1PPCAC_16031, partial [Pristionchus entomophagus]
MLIPSRKLFTHPPTMRIYAIDAISRSLVFATRCSNTRTESEASSSFMYSRSLGTCRSISPFICLESLDGNAAVLSHLISST